ncbi:MAG: peptide ABC transporter permease [Caldimonas sp.]|nr:MAG: peptide ABC transporter permease [Caldimonas sp.]
MNLARLSWTYLWARPWATLLHLGLLSLSLASITLVLLVSEQIEKGLQRDLAGIDLVVGAKGSPMQLILAGVFHLDVPTGNIPAEEVQRWRAHPLVEAVIPVSLGDSYRGFRIVGTEPAYLTHYGARFAQGRVWRETLEAVLGADVAARTGLRVGDRFVGVHGLGGEGEAHGETPYTVVGVLERSGRVLDRLILTSTESVWEVHEAATALDEADRRELEAEREVTLLLLRYRSPLAAVSLPRLINAETALQAASAAQETARLLRIVGVGVDVVRGFGWVLLAVAALSVLMGLYHAVRERAYDLAMLRMLGAPPHRVAAVVLAQALWLAAGGLLLGLALGHGLTAWLGWLLAQRPSVALSGWTWLSAEWAVVAGALAVAVCCAALPAWQAYRLDVMRLLQAPR